MNRQTQTGSKLPSEPVHPDERVCVRSACVRVEAHTRPPPLTVPAESAPFRKGFNHSRAGNVIVLKQTSDDRN